MTFGKGSGMFKFEHGLIEPFRKSSITEISSNLSIKNIGLNLNRKHKTYWRAFCVPLTQMNKKRNFF